MQIGGRTFCVHFCKYGDTPSSKKTYVGLFGGRFNPYRRIPLHGPARRFFMSPSLGHLYP